ncbi:cadherin-related family member 4 [Mixophyes fleayi]|uniref:cadherin-related family member 4 n=1 Tax=Mixophyes fleayi TaxID=3061075 RepID=UPI003F4E3C67
MLSSSRVTDPTVNAMGSLPLVLQLCVLLSFRVVLGQVEFLELPFTASLPENSPAGTTVHSFTLGNCTDPNPTVTITDVSPSTSFFNTPTQSVVGASYTLQITLSSSAALNAEVVNQYIVEITAQCGNETVTGHLFVMITDVPEPQCEPKFSSQVGDAVQVYSNVPASSPIYIVALQQPKYTPVTFKITQPSPSPFTISSGGNVNAPASGFSNKAASYQLQITVTDNQGNTCNGTLNINVLPVYDNPINFTTSSINVTIPENGGPDYKVTAAAAKGHNVLYEMITLSAYYYIESGSGTIKTTYNLDLDTVSSLVSTVLLVRAYDQFQRSNSATVTVTINVLDVNDIAPRCSPAVLVTQVPETEAVGEILVDFSCTDPDYSKTALTYSIIPNANSQYSFEMLGSKLQINTTLNYDSFQIASENFQYSATVVVTDNGTPKMTTNIPVFVTVTPVNEDPPKCIGPLSYNVNENSPFGTAVGQLNATDADYPFNNVEFSIVAGPDPPVFYIVPRTGQIRLLGPLDFETKINYSLSIKVVDLNNDITPDPGKQLSTFCSVTINVQDYNDNPPVCDPPFYHIVIYSTLSTTSPVQPLSCSDKDVTSTPLLYTIVGGNTNSRFRMNSNTLMHNTFSYNPDGLYDPLTYELLIQVTDSTTPPQYSTTATVFVTVIPWTTTQPTTTTTTPIPEKQTKIINQTLGYWEPDVWFMVVLTLTVVLLLAAIALLTWALCKGSKFCARGTNESTQPLLQDRSLPNAERPADLRKQNPPPPTPAKEKKDIAPISPLSLQFDGRAKDPVTGRDYLFNSQTGERRWV